MSGKRLLLLHQAFVAGGAEQTTQHMLAAIDRDVFSHVSLLCPEVMTHYWTSGYDTWLDSAPLGLSGWFATPAKLWRDARALSNVLRAQHFDVAIGMMQYASAVLALAIRMARVKTRLLASHRGPAFEHLKHFEPSWWRRQWIGAAICAASHAADALTMPSQGTAEELHRHCAIPHSKMQVIFNGIDLAEATRRSAQAVELPASLCNGSPFAVIAARLSEEKRIDWVLDALAQGGDDLPLHLLILGDGPARPALEQRAQTLNLGERVIFYGQVDDVLPFVARGQMFIHTCQYEGFGYAILEALAVGTPVIATDCPYGPREILAPNDHAPCGLLVQPGETESLAQAMMKLANNCTLRDSLVQQGMERATALDLSTMHQRYRRLIATL